MGNQYLIDDIKRQITGFDNKASILLTVNGFILAFTTSFVNLLEPYKGESALSLDTRFYITVIALVLYFTSLLISGGLFVSAIFPRKRAKKTEPSNNYYVDIANMEFDKYKESIDKVDEDDSKHQIWINAKICYKKHRLIVAGIYFLGLAGLCFVAIVSLLIF